MYDGPVSCAYIKETTKNNHSFICLDEQNISPSGQRAVEPCDLCSVADSTALFHHVKVSTLSSKLSHLFNQGANSIELIHLKCQALENLKSLIKEDATDGKQGELLAPLDAAKHSVIFAIVTHKDKSKKSKNLPLFSRISLMRNLKALQLMSVKAGHGYVEDMRTKAEGKRKKKRKKKVEEPA